MSNCIPPGSCPCYSHLRRSMAAMIVAMLALTSCTSTNSPLSTSTWPPTLTNAATQAALSSDAPSCDNKESTNLPKNGLIRSIQMLSADEGWAGGGNGLIHYHDGKWWSASNYVTSEGVGGFFRDERDINGLAMISSTEGWAVGRSGNDGLLLHFQAGCWQRVDWQGQPGNDYAANITLEAVQMLSPTDGWVVGVGAILHYEDHKWIQIDAPEVNDTPLYALSMVSSTEGWAVGGYCSIFHYKDGKWQKVDWLPSSPGSLPRTESGAIPNLTAIRMTSPTDGWAVGDAGLIIHYKDSKWSVADTSTSVNFWGLAMTSPDEGWAVGGVVKQGGYILHYKNGKWGEQANFKDNYFFSIYMLSPNEGWVGDDYPSMLHYHDGTWSQ